MSSSSLKRKLRPAKKALKRFASKIKSQLNNLNLSKAIKVIEKNTNRLLSYCSRHLFTPFRNRFIAQTTTYKPYSHNYDQLLHKNFSAVYVDQLLQSGERETGSSHQVKRFHDQAGTSGGKENNDKGKEESQLSVEDAWREVVARSPQLRPVDERAEEFISKFRQDMKLQKERSLLQYQEMLARSAS